MRRSPDHPDPASPDRVPTGKRRRLRKLVLGLVLAPVVWFLTSYLVADQLTRRRGVPAAEAVPVLSWGKLQPLRLATSDGEELGAWFIEGRADRPAVVLLHGNGGRRGDGLHQAELLAAAGYPALLVTLRAHGDSTGTRNDFGYSARRDVMAAVAWLRERRPGQPVAVWGQSLGAAAAAFAAADLGPDVGGYILECPYRDLRTAVRRRTALHLPPVLDAFAYLSLLAVSPLVLPDLDRIAPVDAVSAVPGDVPVLVLAGGADRLAHPDEARALWERMAAHAELVIFEGAGHVGLRQADPERYEKTVLGFLRQAGRDPRLPSAHPSR
jgi:uncharacterized protein